MMQIVPGSERYYCRVEGCDEFTADNVPYGRCAMHALELLGGATQVEKAGFPPAGTVISQSGVSHASSDPSTPAAGREPKSCPLCGGTAYATRTVNGTQMFKVGCASCGIELKAAWYRDQDAPTKDILSLWNSRSALPASVEGSRQEERVFQAVVYANEGREDLIPDDLRSHGFVKRGLKNYAKLSAASAEGREQVVLGLIADQLKSCIDEGATQPMGRLLWRLQLCWEQARLVLSAPSPQVQEAGAAPASAERITEPDTECGNLWIGFANCKEKFPNDRTCWCEGCLNTLIDPSTSGSKETATRKDAGAHAVEHEVSKLPSTLNPPCQGCGGPYMFDTSIPSVFWNRVIRAAGLPEYLCLSCIVQAFSGAGENIMGTLWGGQFQGQPIEITFCSPAATYVEDISRENTKLRARIRELESATFCASRVAAGGRMNETRELQKQDIDGLRYSLKAIERLLSDVKLLLEWHFRDDPMPKSSPQGEAAKP